MSSLNGKINLTMKVSIIVPNRNYAKYLPDCLDSIISQTHQNIEVLLADGSSDDGSIEILEEYSAKYGWKIYSREDQGQADAIDRGLKLASGDIQCWLNSDDFFLSRNALEKIVNMFQEFPSVDIISLGGYYTDATGHWLRATKLHTHPLFRQTDIALRGSLIQPATFWKPSVFHKIGLDTSFRFVFDHHFFIQSAHQFNMLVNQDIELVGYRLHGENLSVGIKHERIYELAVSNSIFFGHGFRYFYLLSICSIIKFLGLFPKEISDKISKIVYSITNMISYLSIYRLPSI
jgi:glycosyltransferase involved in cell wall biosynthesis